MTVSRNFLDRQAMESSSEDDNEIIIIAGAAVAVLRAVVAEEENDRVSDKGMKWTWPQQYNYNNIDIRHDVTL